MSINGLGSLASLLQYLPSNVVSDLVNKSSADANSAGTTTDTTTSQTDGSDSSDGTLSADDITNLNVQMQAFFNQNDPLTQGTGSSDDDGGYLDFLVAPAQSDLSTYNAAGGVNTNSASTFSLFG